MKVILTADVKAQGKKDDIIEVADGYANNFLIKKKLAVPATTENLNNLAMKKAKIKAEHDKKYAEALNIKQILANESVYRIYCQAGKDNKLFGAITNKDVAEVIEKAKAITIDKKKIELPEVIKSFGTYKVKIKLFEDIELTVAVSVEEA